MLTRRPSFNSNRASEKRAAVVRSCIDATMFKPSLARPSYVDLARAAQHEGDEGRTDQGGGEHLLSQVALVGWDVRSGQRLGGGADEFR